MEPTFRYEIYPSTAGHAVSLYGTIDVHAEPHFNRLLSQVEACEVRLDFSNVGRINSMGVAVLLRTLKLLKVQKQANVKISGLNQLNSMLFKMTGIFMLATEERLC